MIVMASKTKKSRSSLPEEQTLSLEHRVLLLCARGCQTMQQKQSFVRAWQEQPSWKYLSPRIRRNGLMPLLMHHVELTGATLPQDALKVLQTEFSKGLQVRLNLFSELRRVTELLKVQGFPVLAYKGPVMAQMAYGSMALRPFSDLDLLISPEHHHEVVALLESHGYERESKLELPSNLQQKRESADYEVTLCPQKGTGYGQLDVHWQIAAAHEMFPLTFEAMWERRVASELDVNVLTLCREDLILCLCSHGIKHTWHRLEWIACLLSLLESGQNHPLDWDVIESQAKALNSRRILYLGLRLAIDLAEFGRAPEEKFEAVPHDLRRRVETDGELKRLARQVWQVCLYSETTDEPSLTFFLLQFSVRVRDSWRLRFLYLYALLRAHLLPHPEDAEMGTGSMAKIYVRRMSRIVTRRLRRWGVVRASKADVQ